MRPHRAHPAATSSSAFARYYFPSDVIVLAVRWYLRFNLSYRDLEELLAERGIEVDHTSVYRWVQRFTPLLADAARPCRHAVGSRWQVDETYVKVAGQWRYVYRAMDEFGRVIDVYVARRRDAAAARRFFDRAITTTKTRPVEVVTDRAATYPIVLDDLLSAAWHRTDRYANNRIEADHGRLKARLRPMRGLKRDRNARVIIAGHASSPERPPRPLRAGGRGAGDAAGGRCVSRAGRGDLIREMEWLRCSSSSLRATAPRNVLAALPKSVHAGARRALNGPHLVALVRAGARFEAGRLVERPDEAVHDGPIHEVAA